MEKKLEEKLVKKYPSLFAEYGGDPRYTCMSRGMEHGDGWYDILDELCAILETSSSSKYHSHPGPPVVLAQVKQKYGGLTVYLNEYTDYTRGAIAMAGAMSYKTCEACGMPGERRGSGYILTLCDKCNAED